MKSLHDSHFESIDVLAKRLSDVNWRNPALAAELRRVGVEPEVIGGAERAGELDALRAIEQGTRVALAL